MRTRAARKLFTEGPKIFEPEIPDSDDEQDDYEKLQILQNVHKDLISGQNSENLRNFISQIGAKLDEKFVMVE